MVFMEEVRTSQGFQEMRVGASVDMEEEHTRKSEQTVQSLAREICLICLRNCMRANVVEMEGLRRGVGGDEVRREMRPGLSDLEGHRRGVGFHTEKEAIGAGVVGSKKRNDTI